MNSFRAALVLAAALSAGSAMAMDRRAPDAALDKKAPPAAAPAEKPAEKPAPEGVAIVAGVPALAAFSPPAAAPESRAAPALKIDAARTLILGFSNLKAMEGAAPAVRVFINKPDATAETPTDDPHYAGEISFYPLTQDGATRRFELPIAETLKKLEALGEAPKDLNAVVTLVPIDQGKAPARPESGLAAPASAKAEPRFTARLVEMGVGGGASPQ